MMNSFGTENNSLRLGITGVSLVKTRTGKTEKSIRILSVHPKCIRLMCRNYYCSEVAMEQSAPTVPVVSTEQMEEPSNMGG
jgi:hypothetical protein